MFKRASDSQLLRCYEQATSNPETDMRIVEILEKEMYKRRLTILFHRVMAVMMI